MNELALVIEGVPVPASRPRVFRNGGVAYSTSHLRHKAHLEKILPSKAKKVPKTPVKVFMQFVMPRYKTSEAVTHRADLDNLEKIVLDAMTKCNFWEDDYLVTSVVKSKRFAREGEQPCTRIRIVSVENPDEESDTLFNS